MSEVTLDIHNNEMCIKCHKAVHLSSKSVKCNNCLGKFHSKCAKNQAVYYRDEFYCRKCLQSSDILRYNPYYDVLEAASDDVQKIYLQNYTTDDTTEVVSHLSEILEDCSINTIVEYNKRILPEGRISETKLFFKFLNIDGNMKNFDTLQTTLHAINHNFSVLGLAETNVDPVTKDLYRIPQYTSAYQNKLSGKKTGSGVAIYIHDSISIKQQDVVSICTKDIETLFIIISSSTHLVHIGVVYRPPSVNIDEFNENLREILSSFKTNDNVVLMEDFNINLFHDNKLRSAFEEIILCNGFTPTISVATHSKPQCQMSCIDNILGNKAENEKATGVIKTHISHHRSLFLSFEYLSTKRTPTRSKTNDIKYDFSKQSLHHMSNLLINNLNSQPKNFAEFSKRFIDCMDEACKRNRSSPSKRNRLENPWITTALINSISKRDRLYRKWKQK